MSKWRLVSQIFFLLLFLALFVNTKYDFSNEIRYPVNVFLKADPLVAVSTMLSSREIIPLFSLAIFIISLTLIFGRFICGWVCPLGVIFDSLYYLKNKMFGKAEKIFNISKSVKYYILIFLLVSSLFGLQLIWIFDPISLLIRSLTISVSPAFDRFLGVIFDFFYRINLPVITFITEVIYGLIKRYILSPAPQFFYLNIITLAFFLLILFLSTINKRFWCKFLCPLGALLGILSRFSLVKRKLKDSCIACAECTEVCSMKTIDENFQSKKAECILCGNCQRNCQVDAITFGTYKTKENQTIELSRRYLITSIVSGFAVVPFIKLNFSEKQRYDRAIRPPSVDDEGLFLNKCIRCGECMKVCPTNVIQPSILQKGIEGFYSPMLITRMGYCEYFCNLCGQVCPSGAIKNMSLPEKQKFMIGIASFNKNRCLPWYKNVNCLVCEEHCPVPTKAIRFQEKKIINEEGQTKFIKFPYVVEKLCIGCGICEFKCPVPGSPGIFVRAKS